LPVRIPLLQRVADAIHGLQGFGFSWFRARFSALLTKKKRPPVSRALVSTPPHSRKREGTR
jgi:hypothetical protein